MAVNIHITIIELNALHTKRQNLFQELDAVIHLLMEAKHWGLRKSRNATSLNSRFKSLRSEERFSRNAETDLVCRLLLEKKKIAEQLASFDKSINILANNIRIYSATDLRKNWSKQRT